MKLKGWSSCGGGGCGGDEGEMEVRARVWLLVKRK